MTDPAQMQKPSGKEVEAAPGAGVEVVTLKDVGREAPLPQEVSGAGVKIHPTSINLPQPVAQMGVTAVGQSTPPPAVTVTLPLSDDEIAQGLHQSITSSWRWLAEWCVRKLKQLHRTLVKRS